MRALSLGAPDSRLTKLWGNKVDVVRGDVTRPETLAAAVRGVDRVVHLAYLIPPACLEKPDEARKVNVDGTRNMLEAVKAYAPTAKFLFASSLDVFGRTADQPPPRKVTDPSTRPTSTLSTSSRVRRWCARAGFLGPFSGTPMCRPWHFGSRCRSCSRFRFHSG